MSRLLDTLARQFVASQAARQTGEVWNPLFPDVATPQRDLLKDEEAEKQASFYFTPWQNPPPTSHVKDFRFYDALSRPAGTRVIVSLEQDRSIIEVRFKATAIKKQTHYAYYFYRDQFALARQYWNEIKSADHPGAHPMIQNPSSVGVEYRRLS